MLARRTADFARAAFGRGREGRDGRTPRLSLLQRAHEVDEVALLELRESEL